MRFGTSAGGNPYRPRTHLDMDLKCSNGHDFVYHVGIQNAICGICSQAIGQGMGRATCIPCVSVHCMMCCDPVIRTFSQFYNEYQEKKNAPPNAMRVVPSGMRPFNHIHGLFGDQKGTQHVHQVFATHACAERSRSTRNCSACKQQIYDMERQIVCIEHTGECPMRWCRKCFEISYHGFLKDKKHAKLDLPHPVALKVKDRAGGDALPIVMRNVDIRQHQSLVQD